MADTLLLGAWIRRFLLEYLVKERNLARNTQQSYRDTLRLLLPHVSQIVGKDVEFLEIEELSSDNVRAFLQHLEVERGSSVGTRNQRLAAIHSLAHFIAIRSPEHIAWSGEIQVVPFKKTARPLVTYLEKAEMDELLRSPEINTSQGRRDHALLLFLYNTGARADEAAHVLIRDLAIGVTADRDPSSTTIRGKGSKMRQCPLWSQTVIELAPLTCDRTASERVFLNRRGNPMTRFGVHSMVWRHAARAATHMPSISAKRVSPHCIRHTTAMHLLRSGVDINTIRAWLGHVSLATTNIYAEADLEMKAKALAACEVKSHEEVPRWRENPGLMDFLRDL